CNSSLFGSGGHPGRPRSSHRHRGWRERTGLPSLRRREPSQSSASEEEGAKKSRVNVDVDFVQLAKQLRSVGQEVMAVLLEGPAFRCPESVALSKAFEEIGVDVFWVGVEWFEFRRPLMKAVLNPELGECGFVEVIAESDVRGPLKDITGLVGFLMRHGFMSSPRDAIAPAIARFWHLNGDMKPLTVWPAQYPLHALDALLTRQTAQTTWQPEQEELAFVLPVGSKGKAT
ncbi:unnamed protein product, partial [Polarella glacialis]